MLEAAAGSPPRPTRVARAIGLDKSLASRFVRAVQAESDLELMHVVPSPEGLHILADRAEELVGPDRLDAFLVVVRRFESLLDRLPGGRTTLDAQIADRSENVRERTEHTARQAAFKSMSFLLGRECELLATSLFLVPSANGRTVDAIEIQRRIGLRRMRPGTPLPILSFHYEPEDELPDDAIAFESVGGPRGDADPEHYLLREFGSASLPELEVLREGKVNTLVLTGDGDAHAPTHVTSAWRIRNAWNVKPEARVKDLRSYVLHIPTRRLVRDLYLADGLWPSAMPRVTHLLSGPRGHTPVPGVDPPRHYANVDLTAPIETIGAEFALPERPDHPALVKTVLARAGLGTTTFRGWRCAIAYPVPMLEMMWWLEHTDRP